MRLVVKIYRLWLTPKFPEAHIRKILEYKPSGLRGKIKNFFRTWLVHPVKRRLAKYYLWFLQKFFDLKVVGVTGSAGKTTTKEMLASILKEEGKTVYSFANIDPVYNIPTTILRCTPRTRFLVLEMGVEYKGEMDFYLWLAKPDVGIITNIYSTHTLNFKDEKGVFREKSKLVKNILHRGFAVLNKDNFYLKGLRRKIDPHIIWFGRKFIRKVSYTSDFRTALEFFLKGRVVKVCLPILGKQFAENALAAAFTADALGVSVEKIIKGLDNFEPQEHRMTVKKLKSGAVLIDDSYNNNPAAAKQAIDLLSQLSVGKKSILVFGDMLELGKKEIDYHKEVGKYARNKKIDLVIGVGRLSSYVSKINFKSWEEALPKVKSSLDKNCLILVKGSRLIGLDHLVNALD